MTSPGPYLTTSLISRIEQLLVRVDLLLPTSHPAPDWSAAIAFRYKRGRFGGGALIPVENISWLGLEELKEIDLQKEKIQRNTLQFVHGYSANNVLLTGARGTGKSSLVKACLQTYHSRGLRLIEVDKLDLVDISDIIDMLATRPEKFIVFCDDLSFEEGEPGYKALKSALDGSISGISSNVLIYATSNRRHLLPEHQSDNLTYRAGRGDEIHPGEMVEEKISLSDRFGLWISFYPFNQAEYLAIVAQWLNTYGVEVSDMTDFGHDALIWSLERGSRSGRVAWQFARDFAGRTAMSTQ